MGLVQNTMDAMEHLSKPSEDVSEVIFGQPEERGRMAQYRTDGMKMDDWMTRSLTMGPGLGQRTLTGRLMMC